MVIPYTCQLCQHSDMQNQRKKLSVLIRNETENFYSTKYMYLLKSHPPKNQNCTVTNRFSFVSVVRCPWPSRVNNGYFMCHPSDDPRYGATCRFGCYPGYKLIGNSLLECLVTGHWNNNQPYCGSKILKVVKLSIVFNYRIIILNFYLKTEKTCPSLPPAVGSLKYTCTDENKYRSICTYSCASGYDITPGMSRVRVCTAYGTWRGAEPTCTGNDLFKKDLQEY